jgi:hypothetical protein
MEPRLAFSSNDRSTPLKLHDILPGYSYVATDVGTFKGCANQICIAQIAPA